MIKKSSVYNMLQIGLVLSQFLPGMLPTVEAAQLVYENTFTDGWGDTRKKNTPRIPSSCENSAYSTGSDPASGAGQVARFFQVGDGSCLSSDNKHRTQVNLENNAGKLFSHKLHTHYFVGFRFYMPADFPGQWLDSNNSKALFHYINSSKAQTLSPELNFVGVNGAPGVEIQITYWDNSGVRQHPWKRTVATQPGWNTLVYHVKQEYDNTGVFEFWLNGEYDKYTGQTATNPSVVPGGATVSYGIYWGTQNRPEDFKVYIDDIRIAEGSDGFDLVNPGNGIIPASDDQAAPPAPPVILSINN